MSRRWHRCKGFLRDIALELHSSLLFVHVRLGDCWPGYDHPTSCLEIALNARPRRTQVAMDKITEFESKHVIFGKVLDGMDVLRVVRLWHSSALKGG